MISFYIYFIESKDIIFIHVRILHSYYTEIEKLPPELFQCKKLRTLNLGNNYLQSLPSRFGELINLTQLELRGNGLECLPVELGECKLLKRSGLIVEEPIFNTLPTEVKEQLWRAEKEAV
ncbi:volume-regulated anion channel subunit LRRC8A [Tachysurus ichikawai]